MYDKICDIICEQLDIDKSSISPETDLITDLGCDSLDIIELTSLMQDEFGFGDIPEDDLRKMSTIADLVAYAEAHS